MVLRVRPVNLALAGPVETALGAMRTAPLVLIDLETVEGVVGRSYVRCYTPHALPASAPLIDDLGDVIAGAAVDPRGLNDKLRRQSRLLGWQGLTGIGWPASRWPPGTHALRHATPHAKSF